MASPRPDSDIDVAIILDPAEFQKRRLGGKLPYNNRAAHALHA